MDTEKYDRPVTLTCPTCGCTEFGSTGPEPELFTCQSCGRILTRDELIAENSENIDEHLKEVGKEVMEDMGRELKNKLASAFKGSKFFKVK